MKMCYEKECGLCPRCCRVDRNKKKGFCGSSSVLRVAKIMKHFGEEPVISGTNGSGAVFFSGCVLKCPFCQNYPISHELNGKDMTEGELEYKILALRDEGVHNINLVTPTHYLNSIVSVLTRIKPTLGIPVVYNTGGYELSNQIKRLDGLVDIYLPDLKYYSSELSSRFSAASDYFINASAAIKEMVRQQPQSIIENGIMKRGVIIRHLILPGCYKDSIRLMEWIRDSFEKPPLVSVMRQYTPCYRASEFPEINRKLTTFEYRKVLDFCAENGLDGFSQQKGCETLDMTPDFSHQ